MAKTTKKIIKDKIVIIAGMPRSGTTFLYQNIQKHPDAFVPYRKEVAFFIYYYSKGSEWYLNHFKGMKPGQIGFDISSIYLLDEYIIDRIIDYNPNIKIITGVRDPVEFALSLYRQFSTYSIKMPPFEEYLKKFTFERVNNKLQLKIADNFIPMTIDKIQKAFGDNLLLYSFNLFKRDPLIILKAIEAFVGLKPYYNNNNFDNVVINSATRNNIKIISQFLATGDIFPRILRILFPSSFIRFVTSKYLKRSGREKVTNIKSYPLEHIRIAEEIMAEQRTYFNTLFADYEIQLGSGRPFSYQELSVS